MRKREKREKRTQAEGRNKEDKLAVRCEIRGFAQEDLGGANIG